MINIIYTIYIINKYIHIHIYIYIYIIYTLYIYILYTHYIYTIYIYIYIIYIYFINIIYIYKYIYICIHTKKHFSLTISSKWTIGRKLAQMRGNQTLLMEPGFECFFLGFGVSVWGPLRPLIQQQILAFTLGTYYALSARKQKWLGLQILRSPTWMQAQALNHLLTPGLLHN